ncbi:MAG: DNA polymerase I [Thermoleophilia bacterium]|nr:DNA polymerase I [Thermoleophilia bacterium]
MTAGGQRGPLFLLDGSNVAYRAFFALPEGIATSGGFPTNALYGFCLMVIKILSEYRPDAVIVAWDSREKTFRHEEFEEYKAQRKPMPDALSEQWPYFCELGSAFGFVNLAVSGYEADDILATLARQAEAKGRETVIVTGDRDAMQLAGEHVRIMANTRGMTEVKIYDPAAVEERFGVPPRLIPDLIGLKGDTSDNIPGVPGIGEKTAAQLLAQFGGLEEVLAHADEVSGAKRRELLREHREIALLSKKLASLEHDAPIDIDATEVLPHEPQRDKLKELFTRFEFNTLLERVEPLLPAAGQAEAARERSGAQLAAAQTVSRDPGGLDGLVDWSATVGVAAEAPGAGSAGGLWIAQPGSDGGLEDFGAYSIARLEVTAENTAALAGLLGKGEVVCHDFKSARTLRGLLRQSGHDTYLAAYLLAPGKRDYRLEQLTDEAGIAPPVVSAPAGCTPDAAPDAVPAGVLAPAAAAALVLPLAAWQQRALRDQGMWELFQTIELPLTGVLIDMEQTGIHLDCYRLGEITGKIQDQMEELETCIYELAGEEFNLGSPQQLGRILFDRLGLQRQRKTKTGYSTDAKTLDSLRDSHPIVSHLLNHREFSKLMSTYLLALPQVVDPDTGRLHTTFNQTVAATGRLSSSDPNLQNIPVRTALGAQIRQCFTAEPGNLLVVADYSQIELRIMAHLSGETTLLESFARGEDIHTRTAAEVFGVPEDQVDSTHRRYAKAVNFGIMYGISAFGLSQNLGIEREEAAAYIERYFERLPRVKSFIEETIESARRQGYVATVFGRRRPIPELASGSYQERSLGERLAVNSVIQGSAADVIKVAMIRCHERLTREFPKARLVLQVHDELVFEAPEGDAQSVRAAMVGEMVAAFPMEPPLGVDAGVGVDWLSAK